jgi:hypothetical protein
VDGFDIAKLNEIVGEIDMAIEELKNRMRRVVMVFIQCRLKFQISSSKLQRSSNFQVSNMPQRKFLVMGICV